MLFGRVLQKRRRIRRWRRDNSTGSLQLDQLKPDYGALSIGTTPTFAWTVSGNAADYRVQVDTTEAFAVVAAIRRNGADIPNAINTDAYLLSM
jgi:hypothetical protein